MKISRRSLMKVGLAAGASAAVPSILRAQTTPPAARTVHMAMAGALGSFDPIFTTATITTSHGLAIYDTLFSLDSKFMPQPQMVGKWGLSDDKRTYTFELRDGLRWHDSSVVTAADCVASIHRWGQVDAGGMMLLERAKHISKKDEKSFTIELKEPLGVLPDVLASISGSTLFVMREKDANRPATEQVTANIGSGPFRFNEDLAKPGASFTYDRNEQYVPRKESADGLAGGKVVNIDRVVWDQIADQQTALAALQAGEIDFFEQPPADLLPLLKNDPNIELELLDKTGSAMCLRMNCLQKPFDNVKARQAILHLIDQEAFLRVVTPDPNYAHAVTSIFGNDTPYSNGENTGWYKKGGDPEKAKQLLKEAGYAGEKVVILQPTDIALTSNAMQLLANMLRKIGINAELAPSDWGALTARRRNKGPVEEGGWSMFMSSWSDYYLGEPIGTSLHVMNGEKGWYGWPKNDDYEALRKQWPDVSTVEDRKALARKMQKIYWEVVPTVLLGEYTAPIARRKTLTGLIGFPNLQPMWKMKKA
ncbi:ABC transporter substrate-binding protein [Mesorhizobium sp.]|uniref:ABC transporter substrate-binding protein n=1 Tax=Mesorhizobium sp. TaxID=1871066 RepID=UPI000FE336E8|nr:ABC transporter substrate-binding protein [Mesorhizobium sp.]RWH67691.1 MAG: ABC transporter substrate-binding protein [Mesorhizobium sp.]RWK29597.1 MAG: ABC transporter substrate-binding protein [Mesorhizobium sp.]RWL23467.1 MAG: ABC transporter substrate-binding protein [Mesorhizobium sp.]RWL25269.1 MAG: ABC transporter substrate-binding protein [Mesorhizobium sp.]RWL33587.1 MAG: ABC transporter substrate-binding protein [Mesorhizobium sp.]